MVNEDVFSGYRSALILLFAYQNAVAKEIGIERAVAVQTKMIESLGAKQGAMMKEKIGIKGNDAIAAIPLIKSLKDSAGFNIEIVAQSPQRVVIKNGRCPFYEAAMAVGMDPKAAEASCRMGSMKFADSAVKQINPNLSIHITNFRSTPDGSCTEEIALS